MIRFLKWTLIVVGGLAAILFVAASIITSDTEFGGSMNAASLEKAQSSPQYFDGSFENTPEVIESSISTNIKDMMGGQVRTPPGPFPMERPLISQEVDSGIRSTWFGHATVYVEMNGKRILTDPMLSSHAFPVKMVAPERFNPPPLEAEELPPIDFVTISHDHYDHLDMKSIQVLAKKGAMFFVGLGIKAHLMEWGVAEGQISEMDWWESVEIDGFSIHCTPARHYSGRKMPDNSTLWTSWIIKSGAYTIFHSGDSGYEGHFREIGEKLGPVDLAFIKVGDYGLDLGWQDIHMRPEKSVQAARDIGAKIMFPIHWGTFDLSNHDWFEPINLAVASAKEEGVTLVTPKLGQTLTLGDRINNESWWKELEQISLASKKE